MFVIIYMHIYLWYDTLKWYNVALTCMTMLFMTCDNWLWPPWWSLQGSLWQFIIYTYYVMTSQWRGNPCTMGRVGDRKTLIMISGWSLNNGKYVPPYSFAVNPLVCPPPPQSITLTCAPQGCHMTQQYM